MKLIKPSEISVKILTLLEESDERVIIVSPYMRISKWYKLINKFKDLKTRSILIEIYVRDDPDNLATYRDLDQLALPYKKIPHLHSKLYMNERYGIVTSMNLLLSSELNTLEIGYVTETQTEYNELAHFFYRYIRTGDPVHRDSIVGQHLADPKIIMHSIREKLNKNTKTSWLWLMGTVLHISTGCNNYRISINDGYLRISARLKMSSDTKQKSIKSNSLIINKIKDLCTMKIEISPDQIPKLLQLSGQSQNKLKSTCINGILEAEESYMIESVCRFINAVDDLAVE